MEKSAPSRRHILGQTITMGTALSAASLLPLEAANATPARANPARANRRRSPVGPNPFSGAIMAPTPPMGWNSWNSFATTLNEAQALETADIMARQLKPFGYNIFTIDIQWYEAGATSYTYNEQPAPILDAFGRLLPAPNRFPSSVNGNGFKPLADQIHNMGLKFGVHLMRGIPRLAADRNTPILGTNYHAQDIADRAAICPWNPDMYGVDMEKPGAQAYYNSVFALFASWGVDFVKMDDMSRPYDAHRPEIMAAHNAIVASGRPIILSLSPGETPVPRGADVGQWAQMWRISDDFWDEWPLLEQQFTRFENWNQYRAPGCWPDGDMLPLGRLALGSRDSRFTHDEQCTVMSLWAITRSPLIMGGDLRHLDDWTLSLLTNRDILALNQHSSDNQPHFCKDGRRIWTAKGANGQTYLAVFNTNNGPLTMDVPLRQFGVAGNGPAKNLWTGQQYPSLSQGLAEPIAPHGCLVLSF